MTCITNLLNPNSMDYAFDQQLGHIFFANYGQFLVDQPHDFSPCPAGTRLTQFEWHPPYERVYYYYIRLNECKLNANKCFLHGTSWEKMLRELNFWTTNLSEPRESPRTKTTFAGTLAPLGWLKHIRRIRKKKSNQQKFWGVAERVSTKRVNLL